MELLILATKIMLITLILWSGLIMFSITKMMVTVRSIRGTSRRTDFIEGAAAFLIFALLMLFVFKGQGHFDHLCTFAPSFGVAAMFLLFYMSERHVQNVRNILCIKKNLTKQ